MLLIIWNDSFALTNLLFQIILILFFSYNFLHLDLNFFFFHQHLLGLGLIHFDWWLDFLCLLFLDNFHTLIFLFCLFDMYFARFLFLGWKILYNMNLLMLFNDRVALLIEFNPIRFFNFFNNLWMVFMLFLHLFYFNRRHLCFCLVLLMFDSCSFESRHELIL